MASVVLRMFLVYVVVETAAVAALIWAIGFGWTTLLLLGVFFAGLMLSAGQVRRQFGRLRSGVRQSVLADSGLIAAGTVLVAVPGPVTTVMGLLLLAPPTRSAARPILASLATIGLGRYTPLVTAAAVGKQWYTNRRTTGPRDDYIDAEVVDVIDADPPALSVG
ncbi:FxsA family protein [[Mycobacterium] nativiensis]|uniref:FxsA family protein n=1 Tax=[Mycobacterium] nativiensis TaxID=2855503 RepID=A0ABU5XRU1_9MYCO|nr:FxsA family protein [Mycolicibacter sp. MYC340]MEB3030689.1 FxsA family protein [Mycolicibacter sp. MYC340]